MNRRRLLSLIGAVGVSGCLRLTSGEQRNDDSTDAESTVSSTDAESTVTLTESSSVDRGIYQIWNHDGRFISNSNTGAASFTTSGRVLWEYDKPSESEHNAVDAYARNGRFAVFGFTGDPNAEEPASDAGAQFYGLDFGSEQWVTEFPSDGNHRNAAGVAIGDTTAVVAASDFGSQSEQSPLVYGIDISSGDQIWEIRTAQLPGNYISGALFYDGHVIVFQPNGAVKIDPNSGSIVNQPELGVDTVGSPNRVQDSIYYYSSGSIHSYSLSDESVNWILDGIERPNIQPIVDNSLVVVGAQSGDLYGINRSTGSIVWSTSIRNSIQFVTTTPSSVDHIG